jgi:hypothetical protein
MVLGLPLLKGYYYVGQADALTHLGWVKDIAADRLQLLNFLYPGVHSLSIFLQRLADVTYRRAVLLVVFVFAVTFVLFVPLCVSRLTNNPWAVATGLFAAMLFLPVNNVSVHYFAHPTTQAIMFAAFVLYVTLRYLDSETVTERRISGWGVALSISSVSLLLVHPQQAANFIVLFGTICGLQFLSRRVGDPSSIGEHNSLYAQTAVLTAAFLYWSVTHNRSTKTVENLFQLLTTTAGGAPGGEAAQRGASLAQIGGSIEGLFLKLFFVSLVFVALTGLLTLWNLFVDSTTEESPDRTGLVRYLTLSLAPLTVVFVGYFLSSMTTQHYRQIGFLVFFSTVLGSVALSRAATGALDRFSFTAVSSTLVTVFCVFLLLTTPVLYASPIIFQDSPQVPKTTMVGYENSFEHRAEDVPYVGVRYGAGREIHGIFGVETEAGVPPNEGAVPPSIFREGNLTEFYEGPRYLAVSRKDRLREVELYRGFRYPESGFERLGRSPDVNRVQSNEAFQVYLVGDTNGDGAANPANDVDPATTSVASDSRRERVTASHDPRRTVASYG